MKLRIFYLGKNFEISEHQLFEICLEVSAISAKITICRAKFVNTEVAHTTSRHAQN